MKPFTTDLTGEATVVAEETTRFLAFVIQDEDDVGIPAAELQSLTLTLFDRRTGQILNNRDGVSILNANGGTVDGAGNGELELTPADNMIFTAGRVEEDHVVLVEWEDANGRVGRHVILLRVENLAKVP